MPSCFYKHSTHFDLRTLASFDKRHLEHSIYSVSNQDKAILFYDGDCGLCSRSVRFLIQRDKQALLFYAPIQGETAERLLDAELRKSVATAVYRSPTGREHLRSDAVLHALIDMRSSWRFLARPALWIPRSWRDGIYNWVADRRHRFFPKNSCALPTPEENRQILP